MGEEEEEKEGLERGRMGKDVCQLGRFAGPLLGNRVIYEGK